MIIRGVWCLAATPLPPLRGQVGHLSTALTCNNIAYSIPTAYGTAFSTVPYILYILHTAYGTAFSAVPYRI